MTPDTDLKMRFMLAIRQAGVTDDRILQAMDDIPRDLFVEDAFADRAWDDIPLPIGAGQTISQPSVVALMTQALAPSPRAKVLEVGTGSGYQTAILSRLFRRVYTVERHASLSRTAASRFQRLGLANVTALTRDGTLGWPSQAPFDRIIVTAAAEDMSAALLNQLKIGGVMVAPVGPENDVQQLIKVEKTESGYQYQELIPVRFVPLVEGIDRD